MLKIIIVTLFYIYLVYFLSQHDLGDKREQLVFILNGEKKKILKLVNLSGCSTCVNGLWV